MDCNDTMCSVFNNELEDKVETPALKGGESRETVQVCDARMMIEEQILITKKTIRNRDK